MTDKDTSTQPNEEDIPAELAKSEDISAYVEDRQEEEMSDRAPETLEEAAEAVIRREHPEKRKASRYERLKRARDQYKAEAEELRKKLDLDPEPPSESEPDNPYEEEIERGRREAEAADQLAERDRYIADMTAARIRAEQLEQQIPDFRETIETARDLGLEMPAALTGMLLKSEHGPAIAYMLAKDALDPDGKGALAYLQKMSPMEQARELGAMQQAILSHQQGHSAPPPKVTSAPPPVRPVAGGSAGAPKDLHSLAAKDDISDYAKARRHV